MEHQFLLLVLLLTGKLYLVTLLPPLQSEVTLRLQHQSEVTLRLHHQSEVTLRLLHQPEATHSVYLMHQSWCSSCQSCCSLILSYCPLNQICRFLHQFYPLLHLSCFAENPSRCPLLGSIHLSVLWISNCLASTASFVD